MSGTECRATDETTSIEAFCDQLRWNDLYYLLARGLRSSAATGQTRAGRV
jgi:hypothetical protein